LARSKPKIQWTCEPDHVQSIRTFTAVLPWYGIEIKSQVHLRELDLCKDPDLSWAIIEQMTGAIEDAVARATKTITDSLDYDELEKGRIKA